jgi:hypothetical protein
MFTLKLYDGDFRQFITRADSVSVLRFDDGHVEMTAHMPDGGKRFDLYASSQRAALESNPNAIFSRAIIENEKGRTTEMVWPVDPDAPGKIDAPRAA